MLILFKPVNKKKLNNTGYPIVSAILDLIVPIATNHKNTSFSTKTNISIWVG